MRSFGDLPFPVALGLLGALAVVGVASLASLGVGPLALAFLLIPGALAALYLHGYAARSGPEAARVAPRPSDGGADDRPSEDAADDGDDSWDPLIERPEGSAPDQAEDGPGYSATR